jgi:hypothetical protein
MLSRFTGGLDVRQPLLGIDKVRNVRRARHAPAFIVGNDFPRHPAELVQQGLGHISYLLCRQSDHHFPRYSGIFVVLLLSISDERPDNFDGGVPTDYSVRIEATGFAIAACRA